MKFFKILFFIVIISNQVFLTAQTNSNQPNILLIIADDMGVDALNGFHQNNLMPTTPTLDSLRSAGITFKNVWTAPVCAPTRALIMSGKFGNKTGVTEVPGHLDTVHTSVFKAIENATNNAYADGLIGKWHITQNNNFNHPTEHGIDHYEGVFTGGVNDYYSWLKRNSDGSASTINEYVTSHFTDNAIDWVNQQTQPWFLWLAHVAPHQPFHIPPDSLKHLNGTGTSKRKYYAAIEAMDTEIGRLLNNIPQNQLDNTLIIFAGDNGTPNSVNTNFTNGKGSLFEGGVKVPMIVSGQGVSRVGEVEDKMIHLTDIYATLVEYVGNDLQGGIYNSYSFEEMLTNPNAVARPYNFAEATGTNNAGFCIRNNQYKYIERENGQKYFFDISVDTLESNNLINSLTTAQLAILEEFKLEVIQIKTDYSCNDLILNGSEIVIDFGGSFCPNANANQITCNSDTLTICQDLFLDSLAFATDYVIMNT